MSIFVPNKVYLRGILLHYFIQKKSAAEAHRILVQTYDDNALSDTTCRDWFRRFKNNDFELEDKERSGAPKKFQDKELEQLLDEDPSQTLSELGKILQVDESTVSKRLKGLGMIQKQGYWVPYELKPRDVERRFGTCELLLQRKKRKGFLITGDRYRFQLMRLSRALKEKRPLYAQRHDKVILLHDNARPHVAKPVKTYLETLKWEALPHPPYSPDIAPSDFHLFNETFALRSHEGFPAWSVRPPIEKGSACGYIMRKGRSRRLERKDFCPVAGRRDTSDEGEDGEHQRSKQRRTKERYVERSGRTSVAFDMDRR
ncbi:MOS1T transposase, partial [Pseudoatta argentina]